VLGRRHHKWSDPQYLGSQFDRRAPTLVVGRHHDQRLKLGRTRGNRYYVRAVRRGAILGDRSYRWVYLGIAFTQVVVGAGNIVLAYFSSIGNIRTFATAHIASESRFPIRGNPENQIASFQGLRP